MSVVFNSLEWGSRDQIVQVVVISFAYRTSQGTHQYAPVLYTAVVSELALIT